MRTKLPQVQPESALVSETECIPSDRHSHKTCSVRGLLCHLPALNHRTQESSLPSVFAAISHQRSPPQTHQNSLPFPFSVVHTHTHTHCPSCLCKVAKATLARDFFVCQASSGESRGGFCYFLLVFTATDEYLYLTVFIYNIPLWCGEAATEACLSVCCIPVQQGWAQQRERAAEHM